MNDTLPLFTALITVAIGLALLLVSGRLTKTGLSRIARNHLMELSRAWLLLALYYTCRAILPRLGYPADIDKTPYDPLAPLPSFVFHIFVMTFCTATNFYLRRAILELEVIYKLPNDSSSTRSSSLAGMLYVRVLSALTDPGILASFVISISLLLFPILVAPGAYRSFYVVTAYFIQLIVSSALFIRLGTAYWQFKCGTAVALVAFLYGLLQIAYPVLQLLLSSRLYEFLLTICKISLALYVIAFSSTLSKLAQTYPNSSDLLKRPKPDQVDQSPLQRLGARIEEQAKLYVMFQSCLALTLLIAFFPIIRSGYYHSVEASERAGLSHALIIGVRSLWLIPTAASLQAIGYLVFLRFGYSVAWRKHCAGALRDSVKIIDLDDTIYTGWRNLTLVPVQHAETQRTRVQVVLIHGIFSCGERCWGLLPAILLESPLVSKVHLVSYSHSLWSTAKRFHQVDEELVAVLQGFLSRSDDRVIVFAHSLGGLLSMRAVSDIVRNNPEAAAKIKHLVCAASPLMGSKYASLGLPWSWPLRLSRGSTFILSTVQRFSDLFAPPGYVTGEETHLCTCSFFYGTRDGVAGSDVKILRLPGERVRFPAWHSICAVFRRDSRQASAYLNELEVNSRSVQLMGILLANLMGKRAPRTATIFEKTNHRQLQSASVVWHIGDESWDKPVFVPAHRESGERSLENVLRESYITVAHEEGWGVYWERLCTMFEVAFTRRELLRLTWPSGSTLYLFSNREAGFALVTDDEYLAVELGAAPPESEAEVLSFNAVRSLLERRFPGLPISSEPSHLSAVLGDLSPQRYRSVGDLEDVLDRTEAARIRYRAKKEGHTYAAEELAVALALVEPEYRERGWDEEDKELFRDLETFISKPK